MSQTLHAVFFHGHTARIDHTPSGAAIANGDVVNMGNGFVGVCTDPLGIADGVQGSLAIGGMWKLKKDYTSGPTFSKGDIVYWDEGNDEATAGGTAASDYAFGICLKDAGASDDYVLVLNIPGVDAMIGDDFSEIAQLTDNSGGTAADGTIAAVAATAAATAGGATPTATQVDAGIATAVASIVTGTNNAIKELATKINAIIAAQTA